MSYILVPDLDPAAFATEAVAAGGAASDKIMTPEACVWFIDAFRRFATQSEAEEGTDALTVMSPLAVTQALAALRGLANKATAEAGEDAEKMMTPLRVKNAIDAQRLVNSATATLTWGDILTLAGSTQTINCPGATVRDKVLVGYPSSGLNDGLNLRAWVSAPDTISLRAYNTTGSTITPTAATSWTVTAIRF